MGVRFDRLRYEVFQNLILSPMNTASVRPAVATTPTACGIETKGDGNNFASLDVATTPTACGIETFKLNNKKARNVSPVATTPTACGIETVCCRVFCFFKFKLQQHLPPAVLKLK